MNVASLKLPCLRALCMLVLASMTGCDKNCLVGREVVIPSSDTTDPAVGIDFHLPNGQIVSASPNSVPPDITVSPGTVTIIAKASDDQGVKDVQLWISEKTCSIDPTNPRIKSCSGPGALAVPTASNRDTRTAGQNGCTERLVSHNLVIKKTTPRVSVSYKVDVIGINFVGREVTIPGIWLNVQ